MEAADGAAHRSGVVVLYKWTGNPTLAVRFGMVGFEEKAPAVDKDVRLDNENPGNPGWNDPHSTLPSRLVFENPQ
jgi:hypothetical protein